MLDAYRQYNKIESEQFEDITRVTTVSEVMKLYNVSSAKTVASWIDRGDLTAVKICGVWIISLESVIKWLGKPKEIA